MRRLIVVLMARWKGFLMRLSASNSTFFSVYYHYFYRPKAGSLAEILDRYSVSTPNLRVLQVGANDGMTHDPIHKFIKRDGWRGVLLEPQHVVFEKYLKPLYAKDEGITVLNCALGREDGESVLYTIGFSDDRWATGLATFQREQLMHLFHSGEIQQRATKAGLKFPEDRSKWIKEVSVRVLSAQTIFRKYILHELDLLMVDAEGYDLEVVSMVLESGAKPKAIIFEMSHLSNEQMKVATMLLINNGYLFKKRSPNMLAWLPEISHIIQ